jgi:hypothetical protein
MNDEVNDYFLMKEKALHFSEIGMYSAAQVFATLALAEATRNSI